MKLSNLKIIIDRYIRYILSLSFHLQFNLIVFVCFFLIVFFFLSFVHYFVANATEITKALKAFKLLVCKIKQWLCKKYWDSLSSKDMFLPHLLDFFLIFVKNLGFGIFELSPISFSIHLFKKVCRKKNSLCYLFVIHFCRIFFKWKSENGWKTSLH